MSVEYDISLPLFRGRFGVRYACGALLQGQHDVQRRLCSDINTNTIIPFPIFDLSQLSLYLLVCLPMFRHCPYLPSA